MLSLGDVRPSMTAKSSSASDMRTHRVPGQRVPVVMFGVSLPSHHTSSVVSSEMLKYEILITQTNRHTLGAAYQSEKVKPP